MLPADYTGDVIDSCEVTLHGLQSEPLGKFQSKKDPDDGEVMEEKKAELEQRCSSAPQDQISSLLSTGSEEDEVVSEKEILHNSMLVMVAGHDTSSAVITFIVRVLANNPAIYSTVLQG